MVHESANRNASNYVSILPINLPRDNFTNDLEFVYILAIDNTKPVLRSYSYSVRVFLFIAMVTSLSIGSYFKFVLYRYILVSSKIKTGSYFKIRPINVLILLSAIIHHTTHLFMGINYAIATAFDIVLQEVVGSFWYCNLLLNVGVFAVGYLSVGSLGMAIYRIAYMKLGYWVKEVIGEKRLLCIIGISGLVITIVLTFLYQIETTSVRNSINLCTGMSPISTQIMIDYNIAMGASLQTTTYLQTIGPGMCLVMELAEIGCYVLFFHHCYKNDNGRIRNALPAEDIRDRNTKNAITFLGQFYGFVIEVITLVLSIIFISTGNVELKGIGAYFKFMEFGLLSAVEVLTSASLRASMCGPVI